MLNTMCLDCKKLNNDCKGTECQVWTGCIYKEKADGNAEYLKRYEEVMRKLKKIDLLSLPEAVKEILKNTTDLKVKVEMLEEIAKTI